MHLNLMLRGLIQRIRCRIREGESSPSCVDCDDCGRCRYHGWPCVERRPNMKTQADQLKNLRFYNDPGHGWLRVPMQEVINAGVAGQISTCSYMSRGGQVAYLEEDCDAPRFLAAIGITHIEAAMAIPEENLDDRCFIRGLPAFSPPKVPA